MEFARTVILEKREKKSGLGPLMFMDLNGLWQKIRFYFEMDADFSQPNDLENYIVPVT
jgi:hypothetical protein